MKRFFPTARLRASIIFLAFIICRTAPARADYTATVDPSIQFRPFQGWGTSLAWWAYVIGGFPKSARRDYIQKAFDPAKGLGLNVVRYNIGGGENPQHLSPNKQFLEYRTAVPGYQTSPGQWDWNADPNQRWVLRAAMAKGAKQLEAFSNSPPYWMTKSGSVTGNQNGADNLKPEAYNAFASYLTEVVKHFHNVWGITFRELEPLNEPTGNWWKIGNHQEGCHVDRPNQNSLVKATGAALASSGLSTTVAASDENTIGDADKTFAYYDSTALKALSRINTHSYGGGDRTQLANFALSKGKDLWMSEYGDGDASGLTMSGRILEDISGLHPSAWVYWQVVDSAGGWGFLKNPLHDATTTAYTVNKKYYVMGNYSKFIRPGYRFIAINDPHSLAAYDARSRRLIIVTTNREDRDTEVTYDLRQFTRLGRSVTAYRTSPTEDLAQLPPIAITGQEFHAVARAKSVTTYVIRKVVYRGALGFNPNAYYKIINRQSGLLLQQSGHDLKDFTPITQGVETANDSTQQWRLVGQGNGVYKVVNRNDGLLMEVGSNATQPGAAVDLYHDKSEPPGKSNQQWSLISLGNGYYELINTNSGLALDSVMDNKQSAIIQQSVYKGNLTQQWQIIKVAP
ncbi:MAG: RICIN domain-containing protein [Abitibacteriaceae bacterium]|nr:RICIN domain-containing protein [Abditibacteriaceae bacterium]